MRVALVSPYSWTYPGGVSRHVEALAGELTAQGHEVRVFAPFDHDSRRTRILHRGARPQRREHPANLVALGGTVGWPSNGAVSNVALTPYAVSTLRRELEAFGPDVVHLHEPVAPTAGWDTLCAWDGPIVGTFHTYSTARLPHAFAAHGGSRRRMNRLGVRIAVSEAAAWTGRRFYGGEYRVIPNGVHLHDPLPEPRHRTADEPLRIVFVGQAVERKGLPVLLRAFEALRGEVDAELTVVGATEDEVAPLLVDRAGVRILGRVSDDERHSALLDAHVLAAPSLGGESFGMVLTEAFAAATPVVASDIAGYRDVVTHGENGLLVPPNDPTELAETLRTLALEPAPQLGANAAQAATRYAWPTVAAEIAEAYEDALSAPKPVPAIPAQRLPLLDPEPRRRTVARVARKAGMLGAGAVAAAGTVVAVHRIGLHSIVQALLHSSPVWVVAALALMIASMVMRAVSWHAILKAALDDARPRFADAFQGTAIGVLMSATLPARLGEPARALIVARRLGRPRDRFPVVLGTLVGQTLLNLLALAVLGFVMFTTIGLFAGRQQALLWYALAPIAIVAVVLIAPALLKGGLPKIALTKLRSGLRFFRKPKLGIAAVVTQLAAWAMQMVSCYLLLVALGLEHRADLGAAAAILFAVNVSAVLPVTPSNLGVFQAACVAVLTGAYGVHAADALGYGIILQAVEIATALIMGMPALLREGLSWREVRLRTLHATPVRLAPRTAQY
jgi:phosphatidylinositol alpha-mannosyltransferase